MKMMKKLAALGLAIALTLGMAITALAYDVPTGQGGSKTIKITNASKGETYAIYKLFDATVGGGHIAYTSTTAISEQVADENELPFYTDDKLNVIFREGYNTDSVLSKKAQEWIAKNGTEITQTTNDDGAASIDFSGLKDGYYYVTTTQGTAISVDSTTENTVTIVDKNSTNPTPGPNPKTVAESNKTIGEKVEYTINFTTTNYNENNTKIYNYKIVDTSTDVKIDKDTVNVTVDGKDPTVAPTIEYADNVLTVTIPWTQDGTANGNHLYKKGVPVQIKYTAEILALDADNSVKFNWNDSNEFGNGQVTVNNFDFNLNKVADDRTTALSGAEFTLAKSDSTTPISFVEKTVGDVKKYVVANSNDSNKSTTIVAGAVNIDGLGAGTYTLTETKAPAGYNLLTAPLTITIDENGNVTFEGKTGKDISVINYAGSTLPSTGGIGTTIFYVTGGLLVIVAVVLLVTKKRMSNRA